MFTQFSLGCGGEDRFRQFRSFGQAFRQADLAHCAGLLVFRQTGAGQVSTHHAFDGIHGELLAHYCAPCDLGGHRLIKQVVPHNRIELVHPPRRQSCQHQALAGDFGGQNIVVGADTVRRDHQEYAPVLTLVQVTHLARINVCPPVQFDCLTHFLLPHSLR